MTAIPTKYRKVVVTRFDRNFRSALEVVEAPYEPPLSNEIVVRNRCAGLSMSDITLASGHSDTHALPPIDLGIEAGGEVVAVGSEVHQFKPGDQVITGIYGNGFREYSSIDANLAILVSQATPEILGLGISGVAASIALEIVLKIQRDQITIVTDAAGSSGHYAVQIARLNGNRVIGVVSSDQAAAMVKVLNCCERIINTSNEDLDAVLTKEYPNGVNMVYESVGGRTFDVCLAHLSPRGRVVTTGSLTEQMSATEVKHSVAISDLARKSIAIYGFSLADYAQFVRTHMTHLLELYYAGRLKSFVDMTAFRGLESVADAMEHMAQGKNFGKVVVSF